MMTKEGVSEQNNKDNQLLVFERDLTRMAFDLSQATTSIPSELVSLGLNKAGCQLIYSDAYMQTYKIHSISPGEILKLNSLTAIYLNLALLASRNLEGDFQLIVGRKIKGELKQYQINNFPVKVWTDEMAFLAHLDYLAEQFKDNIPSHLKPYFIDSLPKLFETIKSRMKPLEDGEILLFDKDESAGIDYPVRILKTDSGQYRVLMEIGDKQEDFIRLDSIEKSIWREYKNVLLDERAIQFLERIEEAKSKIEKGGLPEEMTHLITQEDLLKIYDYMLNTPVILSKLANGQGFRLGRKQIHDIARTLNIVCNPNGEFMLMLETKSKLSSGVKDKKRVIGSGSYGTVKPCWRIDLDEPEEWANKTIKGDNVEEADFEAIFSQNLIENHDYQDAPSELLNVTLLGELYFSDKNVKKSQYSQRAIGDLEQILKKDTIIFTENDKKRITQNILEGLATMHRQGKIHQDIKLANILVYRDKDGYYAKLADYGLAYDPKLPNQLGEALATSGYESPEISLAYEARSASRHRYYHKDFTSSARPYGYQVNKQNKQRSTRSPEAIEYKKAHPANDIWATGIVLFSLQYKHKPNLHDTKDTIRIEDDPLLKGLLEPNRATRFTIDQARKVYQDVQVAMVKEQDTLSEEQRVTPIRSIAKDSVFEDGDIFSTKGSFNPKDNDLSTESINKKKSLKT